jgi:hypothetical protein
VSREENDQMTHMDEPRVISADPATAPAVLPDATDCGGVQGGFTHSTLPWCIRRERCLVQVMDKGARYYVATVHESAGDTDDEGNDIVTVVANAEFIVRACNAHYDLLAALKALTQDSRFTIAIGGNPNAVDALVKQVDAAIAKAERGQ